MSITTVNPTIQLEAGGLVLPKTKVDAGATEQVVARSYRHPALGARPVIRLASDRLGQAEDVAMEFLGFEAPEVSATVGVQQRRSLGFAAWALINDPDNARFALDLVKRMKKAGRRARSKPGHAWDEYVEMAKDLGRSARIFLPAFWEEVGRTFKDLENQTYAGRALNKSLEAERVHAIESDKARRRDVVLEFVLAGCLSGSALSEYGNDLLNQYPAAEAYTIFRDLCTRRTVGGMPPWAALSRDFMKLAKAAKRDENKDFEAWLEEVIDTPALGRAPYQFWKACSAACKQIVSRNPAFAVALLRHTRPEARHYGPSKLWPWFDLLEEWGVLEYLWEDEHNGAPPLGEPVAHWFARVAADEVPVPVRTLDLLTKLTSRLKKENTPLQLSQKHRYGTTSVDIDVLEACLRNGIKVDDPPPEVSVLFGGWLSPTEHPLRNLDVVESAKDERFLPAIKAALDGAISCRGGSQSRGYRQDDMTLRPFPAAAGDRPGICALWREFAATTVARLENTGVPDFQAALVQLQKTLWPDTLRLFPETAERLANVDPVTVLQTTLRAGILDEYGFPGFEKAIEEHKLTVQYDRYGQSNLHLNFPNIIVSDKVHAYVITPDGVVTKRELRLPAKSELLSITKIGDDLAISYRDSSYKGYLMWLSNPAEKFETGYSYHSSDQVRFSTVLADGSVFFGQQVVRAGDKTAPVIAEYFHDRERFWRHMSENDGKGNWVSRMREIDPQTGKTLRDSVPAWFEDPDGGTIVAGSSELLPMPAGADDSPLGAKDGMIGWKVIQRSDGIGYAVGIDGRRWENALGLMFPIGLLRRPAADDYLPVTAGGGRQGSLHLWDPTGKTTVASLVPFQHDYALGQLLILPMRYWHLFKVRDEASSAILRQISHEQCADLFKAAALDRGGQKFQQSSDDEDEDEEVPTGPMNATIAAVKKMLPKAPERLVTGIAQIARRAEEQAFALSKLRDKATQTSTASVVIDHTSDIAAAQWGMRQFHIYGERGEISVSANIAAAADFFKGKTKPGELPSTDYLWFSMIENAGLVCWQTYWRAYAARLARKDGAAVPWLEFLKFWHEQGIAELPGTFDVLEGVPEGVKKNQWGGYDVQTVAGRSTSFDQGEAKFILIESDNYSHGTAPYQFLRYLTTAEPIKPAGFNITAVHKAKATLDPAERAAFIAAVESAGAKLPVPTADELAELGKALATSTAELALVWTGGLNLETYQANFLPAEVRNAFGIKASDAAAARQSLKNLNPSVLAKLYESVIASGLAALFADDRAPVLRSIEKAWLGKMPKRLALEAGLQKKLSALGKANRWQSVNHEHLLALAADPAQHPMLQPREMEIAIDGDRHYPGLQLQSKPKAKPDQTYSSDLIRNIVQLVGVIHAETPAGDPARAAMGPLIKQTTKLLSDPKTMFELRSVNLYAYGKRKPPTPTEWLAKHVGATKPHAKDGSSRVDEGLIVGAGLDKQLQAVTAFRSAKLKDAADLARLQSLLSLDMGDEQRHYNTSVAIAVAVKSEGFQKLAKAIALGGVAKGKWPQNPLHTAADIVKEIVKKQKLGDDAATLYAQLLALPDPTAANIAAWNDWTAAQFKQAAAELAKRKLVLEATRARAGRAIFLPGEWSDLKAPWLPIETWKLAHLVENELDGKNACPAGGPLVLRPYEDLFAAAWKRVVDGDPPRYEEAKRKTKSKK